MPTTETPPTEASRPAAGPVRVVGIGASAGGLEALEAFLRNTPADSGLAFAIVQHLDPTQKDLLAELLQRATTMKVLQVADGTRIEKNTVYVIPPNKDMSILHGVLHLLAPAAARGLRLPIDFFFDSLAEDMGDQSIGVILSGMGTDGTRGLEAIKGKSGTTFVQDPMSARFDSMPGSAIDAGLADVVAKAEELPGRLMAFLRLPTVASRPEQVDSEAARGGIEKVLILLRAQTGHDFSQYKLNTVHRRVERRMGIHQIDRLTTYVRYLQEHRDELDLLFQDLLIGVTSFFRDSAVWEELANRVIPQLLHAHADGQPLRIWVAGCSTGEEAYSLAIIVREAIDRLQPARRQTLQIFATDLDAAAIDKARAGVFSTAIASDVSPERLTRFFVESDGGYRITTSIRETVIFAPHNVITDPPFTKLDLVSCRNLLIYLTPTLQNKLLPLFHYSLSRGGVLVLGSSESIGTFSTLFKPINDHVRIYQRLETDPRPGVRPYPASAVPALANTLVSRHPQTRSDLQADAERVILQRHAPATVLTSDKGDIVFVSGRTGKYLEPAEGRPTSNIFAMARDGLAVTLRDAFRKALRSDDPIIHTNLSVGLPGSVQCIDLCVQALRAPESLRGLVMVVFTDVPPKPPELPAPPRGKGKGAADARVASLERQLAEVTLELQTTREEMQVSQEEVHSANEELQSANEELQSTNEELTTSKEETQSMNEELQTLNHELQARVDDLSRMTNDMKNLFDSTDAATLFLDIRLNVRLFTAGSNRIFKLIQADVGRPITDFASDLVYPSLADDARQVLRTLVIHEREAVTANGGWFLVRILPYRTLDNLVDGVVITFADITASKTLEERLRATQAGLELQIVDQDEQLQRQAKEQSP